ncbi:MAG TPA: hypothetical protein VLH59_00450 [Ignavibacteriaceae bacterium]|nr:hypothetical protein [Ignavibacteriaceae bacterium]
MNSILKLSIVLILILLLNSCDILDNDTATIEPLDSKINFKVIESYDGYETVSAPEIFIEMQTEKIYGCYNYGISTYSRFEDRKVIVDIRGIYKPGVCLTALGPANARIKLGYISGVYEIEFNGNNFNDKYNLLISDSLIILDGKETANTNPSVYFMYRYPKNSFAYLCGTLLSDSSLCSKFIDTLQSVISITEFHFSDIAEIPYPKSSQGHYYDADARFFYYQNESDFEKMREVMKSFKQTYFSNNYGTGLSIISWMNRKIYSWLL